MSTEIQPNITATDSSLISATTIVPQNADSVPKTQNNTTTAKAYTMLLPRRSFDEQRPFVLSIIGFAVFYIIALVIGRIIKTKIAHRS